MNRHQKTTQDCHSDSISEFCVRHISHTRRWIEFSIVMIVVAVLAIIVIPIITAISKSADYATAYSHCKDVVAAFQVAHADALYEAIPIPNNNVTLLGYYTDNQLIFSETEIQDSVYKNFITDRLQNYLSNMDGRPFTFQLLKTSELTVLYYWDQKNELNLPAETLEPNYVYFAENQTTQMVTYEEFTGLNLLPDAQN